MEALRRPWFQIGLLLALTLGVFGRVGQLDFLFVDDVRYIHGNPHFTPLTLENVSHVWTQPYLNLYVPIPLTVWAIETKLASKADTQGRVALNPAVFHWTNVLVHLASVITVFLILTQLFSSPWACFFGAALFAVHPLQAEAVLWVSGLRDLLAGLFALLSVYAFLRFDRHAVWTGSKKKGWWIRPAKSERLWNRPGFEYGLSLFFFLCALLSKATVVTLPIILGVLVVCRKPFAWRRLLWVLSPYFGLAVIFGALAASLQAGERLSHVPPPLWTQPLIALDSAYHYLTRIFLPWPLIFDNGHIPSRALESKTLVFRTLVPIALASALIWQTRKSAKAWWLAAAFAIILLGIAPVSGLKPFIFQFISSVSDRYFYLSMLGVSLAAAAALTRYPQTVAYCFAGIAVLVFASVTFQHLPHWRNTVTLFEHNLVHYPQSWYSHNLIGQRARDTGDLQKAFTHFKAGADLNVNAEPVTNLGVLLLQAKQFPGAIQAFRQAVDLMPGDPGTHQNLGIVYKQAGMREQARACFQRALKLDPGLTTSQQALAELDRQPAAVGGGK